MVFIKFLRLKICHTIYGNLHVGKQALLDMQ
jgi:hypothetical protein